MKLIEQYHLYRLANQFVVSDGYDVLYMNEQTNELWLEKYENKVTKVIRLVQQGFDWKNHLKADVSQVFQRTFEMKQLLMSKHIEIFNIYVSTHEPVDNWQDLKKPLQIKGKKTVKMNVFYLSNDNYIDEETRLLQRINSSSSQVSQLTGEPELAIEKYKKTLTKSHHAKKNEFKNIFTFGKPRFIYLLILVNILMFLMLEFNGGSTNLETLINSGAKYNPAIMNGEWWRIISSMFLHIGFLHLLMNMFALYYLGIVVEGIYGSKRFFVIYFLSGIGGGLTSFAFNNVVAAGASGALFGLFGALLYFGTIKKRLFKQTIGKNLILILLINLIFGFMIPQIDMGAHLGGLFMGFLAAGITSLPNYSNRRKQLLFTLVYLIGAILLIWYGIVQNLHYL